MAVGNLPGRTAKPDRALGATFRFARHGKSGGQGGPRPDAEETVSLARGSLVHRNARILENLAIALGVALDDRVELLRRIGRGD